MKKYDITIVGSGPSGSVMASLCAKAGYDTVLLEKDSIPRDKPCGGGLTAKTINVLRKINCFDENIIERSCNSVQIHLPSLNKSYLLESDVVYMVTVKRSLFDYSLIKYATDYGAEIRTKERFIKYQINKLSQIEIVTDKEVYLTKFLIAADGVNSTILNQLRSELPNLFPKKNLLMGVVAELPFEDNDIISNSYPHLFFDFLKGIDYGWAFPNKETFNVGFGYKIDNNGQINADKAMESFVKNILRKTYSNVKLSGGLLPIFWSNSTPNIQFGRIILIGDSAGFVDEWTGEGIYYAIKSAINAFNVLDLYFRNGNNSNVLNRYTQLCAKDFYTDLRFSHYFANIFRKNTKRYNYLKYKKLRSMFIPLTRGDLSYKFAILKALPYVLIKKYFT